MRRTASHSFLRYGRTVRLVADDGGLLLIDADGSMRKASAALATDPRSLLTVFPSDPLAVGAASKCIRAGNGVFITKGVASVYVDHDVVHADSRRMRSLGGPPNRLEEQEDTQQWTAVWNFFKFVDWDPLAPDRLSDAKATLRSLDEEYFSHGCAIEIRQGELVVCYELSEPQSAREAPVDAASTSTTASGNLGQSPLLRFPNDDPTTSAFAASSMAGLWLADLRRDGTYKRVEGSGAERVACVATRWRLVDVADEKKRQHQRSLTAGKSRLDRRLGTPGMKHVSTATVADTAASLLRRTTRSVSESTKIGISPAEIAELEERLNSAARIIVRFLRRICIDETAKKRISGLAQRKRRELRRMTLSAIGGDEGRQSVLTSDEQLRIMRCYKPSVYASHPLLVPPLNASPQKAAAMRQMHRNRARAQQEKAARIHHELAFLRGTHAETVLRVLPATSQ
jgi:hypothetical protein